MADRLHPSLEAAQAQAREAVSDTAKMRYQPAFHQEVIPTATLSPRDALLQFKAHIDAVLAIQAIDRLKDNPAKEALSGMAQSIDKPIEFNKYISSYTDVSTRKGRGDLIAAGNQKDGGQADVFAENYPKVLVEMGGYRSTPLKATDIAVAKPSVGR